MFWVYLLGALSISIWDVVYFFSFFVAGWDVLYCDLYASDLGGAVLFVWSYVVVCGIVVLGVCSVG